MTDNELKLINMIRKSNNPNRAMVIAIKTICWYLTQHESFAKPSVADSQELA